jgi:hypothetical protein
MVVKLSALSADLPVLPKKIPGTHFCLRLSRPKGHIAAGKIKSIEKSNDLIGYRNRDLPACSTVPQPTTLPRAPGKIVLLLLKAMLPTALLSSVRWTVCFCELICDAAYPYAMYLASNDCVTEGRSCCGPESAWRKATRILRQDSRCFGRDWNREPPGLEARALPLCQPARW